MFPVVTVFVTLVCKFTVGEENHHENKEPAIYSRTDNVHTVFNTYVMPLSKMFNHKLEEGDTNMLLVPNFLNASFEKANRKKKYPKKGPPKWMTQKIIKKSKAKRKKMNYYNQFTSLPVESSTEQQPKQDQDIDPIPEDSVPEVQKKINGKLPRYPMPFHKLGAWKDKHKRMTREVNRSDVFILEDLDAIEFLSHEKDKDTIKTHIKKYW